ncbi:MAG: Rv3235 family protein [Mycobacteriales bacterium]
MTATEQPDRPLVRLAVRRVPARALEPPYDDEAAPALPTQLTEGSLALAFPLPSGVPAVPEAPTLLRLVPPGPGDPGPPTEHPVAHPLAAPRPWAGRLVQAVVEVLSGDRPATQLARWTTAGVYYDLQRAATRAARERAVFASRPRTDVVRSLHVSEPADGVAEVCALIERDRRVRALALRIEGLDGRWQCTSLRMV